MAEVYSVAHSDIITLQTAQESKLGKLLSEIGISSKLDPETILMLFLIYERQNNDSKWKTFLQSLPKSFNSSIFHAPTVVAEVEHTELESKTFCMAS